jgi:hypothetical protein
MNPHYGCPTMSSMENYLSQAEVARMRGCTSQAISGWRRLKPEDYPEPFAPFPEPDSMTGGRPGWLPSRKAELLAWQPPGPGRGHGGGRPRTVQPAGLS